MYIDEAMETMKKNPSSSDVLIQKLLEIDRKIALSVGVEFLFTGITTVTRFQHLFFN